jgi:hypothetical protein
MTSTAPLVAEKTLIINTNFSWKVIINNISIENLKNDGTFPSQLNTSGKFLQLLNFIDKASVCCGINTDERMKQLAMEGGRNGVFKDRKGNLKAKLVGDIIRTEDCKGISDTTDTSCHSCKFYRKTILTMLSNQSKRVDNKTTKTHADSHCPWKHLSPDEKKERVDKCRMERQKSKKKYERLEARFNKVRKLKC